MYKTVYSVPGYAPIVHEYDDYDKAKAAYDMRAGCKTNKGEVTKLFRIFQNGYEFALWVSKIAS